MVGRSVRRVAVGGAADVLEKALAQDAVEPRFAGADRPSQLVDDAFQAEQ